MLCIRPSVVIKDLPQGILHLCNLPVKIIELSVTIGVGNWGAWAPTHECLRGAVVLPEADSSSYGKDPIGASSGVVFPMLHLEVLQAPLCPILPDYVLPFSVCSLALGDEE